MVRVQKYTLFVDKKKVHHFPDTGAYTDQQRKKAFRRHWAVNLLTTLGYVTALILLALPWFNNVHPTREDVLKACLNDFNFSIDEVNGAITEYRYLSDAIKSVSSYNEARNLTSNYMRSANKALTAELMDVEERYPSWKNSSVEIQACVAEAITKEADTFKSWAIRCIITAVIILAITMLIRHLLIDFYVKKEYTKAGWDDVKFLDFLVKALWAFLLLAFIAMYVAEINYLNRAYGELFVRYWTF